MLGYAYGDGSVGERLFASALRVEGISRFWVRLDAGRCFVACGHIVHQIELSC